MREIKFRAWDKINKKMVYGDDGLLGEELKSIIMITLDGELRLIRRENLRYNNRFDLFDIPLELNNFILTQYTGLLDKNGKEIYEGDIVKCFTKDGNLVYNHEIKLPDFYREIWSSKIFDDGMWLPADEGEICRAVEIIGNIYE